MLVLRLPSASAAQLLALSMLSVIPVVSSAAEWQSVMTGKNELIQFDASRIGRVAGGVTGWSRIRLDREVSDPAGAYNSIQAQNLYDCAGQQFTTLKRVYFNGEALVREESVSRQRANSTEPGSIDARLLSLACQAAALAEARVGGQGPRAELRTDPPLAMRADMRQLADGAQARIIPVNDPVHAPAEKPKRIDLPSIDKEAAAAASADALKKGGQAAVPAAPGGHGTAAAPAPAHGAPSPAVSHGAAPAPAAAKMAPAAHGETATHETPTDKRVRELQMATSGPRRVVKKKPAPVQDTHPAEAAHVHWAYEGEGAPPNWSKLRPDYMACGVGKRQSPIDIREGIKVDLSPIKFEYRPTAFNVVDNGHTVQVNIGEGMGIMVMGKYYELIQFHFHRPSEERVNGRNYDMVAHLVHKNEDGQLAVVAVLMEKGTEHPVIQSIWNNMPLEKQSETSPEVAINLMNLLPENRAYWTYMGSLTTPPCSEGVLWMVLKQPVQISPEQVAIFARMYKNNARPVQPSNGRLVKESR